MVTALDPVTGLPLVGPTGDINSIPLGQQVFPYDDLDAAGRPSRLPLYPDDVIPVSAAVVGQRNKQARAIASSLFPSPEPNASSDPEPALNVAVVNQPSGGSAVSISTVKQSIFTLNKNASGPGFQNIGANFTSAGLALFYAYFFVWFSEAAGTSEGQFTLELHTTKGNIILVSAGAMTTFTAPDGTDKGWSQAQLICNPPYALDALDGGTCFFQINCTFTCSYRMGGTVLMSYMGNPFA